MSGPELHPVLARQLRRIGATTECPPSSEDWLRFLEGVGRAYVAADQERYTLERSIEISSREMKELHARLRDDRDKLDAVIRNLPIGLIELDKTFRVTHVNPAACSMLEISEALLGQPLCGTLQIGLAPLETNSRENEALTGEHLLQAMLDGQLPGALQDLRVLCPSGQTVPVAVMYNPISSSGNCTGLLLLITDLSATREAEQRIHEARVVAETARRSAELKSQFLATMSHEIRTPMNGVLGMLQLLLDTDLTDEQREFATTSHRSAEGLLAILNDILDFSKLEAGRYELELVEFGLTDLVSEVVGVFRERAQAKGISLRWSCSPEIPEPVLGDVTRVRQVLTNLVSNAVKFTEAGNVTIHVDLHARGNEGSVFSFLVEDSGIGISEQAIAGLFTLFTQADVSTTRKYGGTGLGLAISKRLTELMGGDLTCSSELGKGTRFEFKLPLAASPNASRIADLREQLGGRRVLVVDDGLNQREHLRELLERWGVDVELASGGFEALGMAISASRRGFPFHAAIIDEHMPQVSGGSLVAMVAGEPSLDGLKVVLMGHHPAGRNSRRNAVSDRVLARVQKPIVQTELRSALLEHLRWSAGALDRPPLNGPRDPGLASTTKERCTSLPPSSRGTILVVDDNPVNRVLAKKVVERLGFCADLVENGQEAVDAVQAKKYVAVLMDCMMPVMDGYTATARIRGQEDQDNAERLPIIGLTADAVLGARERVISAGMDDYVTKPIRTDDIKNALNRWCGMD